MGNIRDFITFDFKALLYLDLSIVVRLNYYYFWWVIFILVHGYEILGAIQSSAYSLNLNLNESIDLGASEKVLLSTPILLDWPAHHSWTLHCYRIRSENPLTLYLEADFSPNSGKTSFPTTCSISLRFHIIV